MTEGEEFLVTIYYREPVYELYHGSAKGPYQWTYRVRATGKRGARKDALTQFRAMERLSNACWGREVETVKVAEA